MQASAPSSPSWAPNHTVISLPCNAHVWAQYCVIYRFFFHLHKVYFGRISTTGLDFMSVLPWNPARSPYHNCILAWLQFCEVILMRWGMTKFSGIYYSTSVGSTQGASHQTPGRYRPLKFHNVVYRSGKRKGGKSVLPCGATPESQVKLVNCTGISSFDEKQQTK